MAKILELLGGLFGGGVSATVGRVATFAGIIAALTPFLIWLVAHKDGIFITISYGEAAFWGAIIAVQLLVAVRTAPGPG